MPHHVLSEKPFLSSKDLAKIQNKKWLRINRKINRWWQQHNQEITGLQIVLAISPSPQY
jgi:hypothetical protein